MGCVINRHLSSPWAAGLSRATCNNCTQTMFILQQFTNQFRAIWRWSNYGGGGGDKAGEFQKAWQKVAKSKVPETNGTSDAAALHVASGLRQCPRLKLAVILELVTDPSTLMLLVYLATPTEKVEPGIGKSIMLKGPLAKLLVCEQWRE